MPAFRSDMAEMVSLSPFFDGILTKDMLHRVRDIVFPFSDKQPLSGSEVGYIFFLDPHADHLWQVESIKQALMAIASVPLDELDLDEFYHAYCIDSNDWRRLVDVLLLLDQGARYLCHGVNQRYIYHFFENLTLYVVNRLIAEGRECFDLTAWHDMSPDHAVLRIIMSLAPLAHSEVLADQRMLLSMTERLRKDYETAVGKTDPHRDTYDEDLGDDFLLIRLLAEGPPQGEDVMVSDFVFWIMRYYTSHYAYHARFGRSPFRNVAVGRQDTAEEKDWLDKCGVSRTAEDEQIRCRIAQDVEACRWTKLEIR